MIETIATVFWLGGLPPAYRDARKAGRSKFPAAIVAAMWPYELGMHACERALAKPMTIEEARKRLDDIEKLKRSA